MILTHVCMHITKLHLSEVTPTVYMFYIRSNNLHVTLCRTGPKFYTNTFEPLRQKTYIRTCAPSEYPDQPVHLHNLIRFFTVRILDTRRCSFFMQTTGNIIQRYHNKIILFLIQFKNDRLTEILQAVRCHIIFFIVLILHINLLNLSCIKHVYF